MKATPNVLSLPLKALNQGNFLQAPLLKVLKAAQGLQARSPARGCWKEDVRGPGEQRRAASGSDWFLRLPPSPSPPKCRGGSSAAPALPAAVPGTPPCSARPLHGKARLGLAASSWRAARPARSGPALEREATRHGRPASLALSTPRAPRLRPGCGRRNRGSGGKGARLLPVSGRWEPGGRRGRARAHGGLLRHPWRGLRAGIAGGPPSPGAACPAEGTDRRPGGPDPALRPSRTASPAARSAALSRSRAGPEARNHAAQLCARFGAGVGRRGGGGWWPASPRARPGAWSCGSPGPLSI